MKLVLLTMCAFVFFGQGLRQAHAQEESAIVQTMSSAAAYSDEYCQKFPLDDSCKGSYEYCEKFPLDDSCKGSYEYCEKFPLDDSCRGTQEYCDKFPLDDSCKGSLCRNNPNHPSCRD
jgi:hypothetical protein